MGLFVFVLDKHPVVLDVLAVSLCDVEVELNTHGWVLTNVHGGSM